MYSHKHPRDYPAYPPPAPPPHLPTSHFAPFSPLPTDSPPMQHPTPYLEPHPDYPASAYPSYPHPNDYPDPGPDPAHAPPAKRQPQELEPHPQYSPGKLHQLLSTYKSRNQILFLHLIAVQAIVVLVMIALVYAVVRSNTGDLSTEDFLGSDPRLESVATYLGLFILAVIFEIGITLDALQKKNIMTLFVLCLFQLAMLVYSAVLPGQLRDAIAGSNADTPAVQRRTRTYVTVIPAVVGLCSLCMTAMLWPLYHEFGWNVFKRIGADITIRRMYLQYQVFACVVKFSAFFLIGFSVQFLILVTGTPTVEFALTIAALPVTLLALMLFAVVVRAESRVGVYCSFVLQAAGMAYFSYKLARIYNTSSSDRYESAQATLTIFSVLCLLLLLATFILMGLCMLNFDKGLRERIPGYASHFSSLVPCSGSARDNDPLPPRSLATASAPPPTAISRTKRLRRPGLHPLGSSSFSSSSYPSTAPTTTPKNALAGRPSRYESARSDWSSPTTTTTTTTKLPMFDGRGPERAAAREDDLEPGSGSGSGSGSGWLRPAHPAALPLVRSHTRMSID